MIIMSMILHRVLVHLWLGNVRLFERSWILGHSSQNSFSRTCPPKTEYLEQSNLAYAQFPNIMTQIRRQPNCEDPNNSRWRDEETRIAPVTCVTYVIINVTQKRITICDI